MSKFLTTANCLTALSITMQSSMAVAVSLSYVDVASQSQEIGISPDSQQITIGHRGMAATFCDAKSSFSCFRSDGISFAIPKSFDFNKRTAKWSFDGNDYVASRVDDDVQVLGSAFHLFFIDLISSSPPVRYWYDRHRGMIAIQQLSPPTDRVFLLRQKCGFAASLKCSERGSR